MPDEIRPTNPVPREEDPFLSEEPIVAGEVSEAEESIDLVDLEGDGSGGTPTQIKAFGRGARSVATEIRHEEVLKRAVNVTGQGATRTRTFHSKLNDAALALMDQAINEWIDAASVEVKCVSSCIGTFEGKKPEPHLILTVWY
ncbi:MAG: hypothetical protein GWP14_04050 [Actinobacteria bacterium]|nr:hypothetical protein [Actinomycetota bacterium]